MKENLEIELLNELRHGITSDLISEYQVLILPENFDHAPDKESLIEASEALAISKILKSNGIKCANSFDLGFDVPTLERRASDIWLGQILIIDDIALPFFINIITNYIQVWLSKSAKNELKDVPKPKVHVEIKMHKNGRLDKMKYDGDGETLNTILKSLNNESK